MLHPQTSGGESRVNISSLKGISLPLKMSSCRGPIKGALERVEPQHVCALFDSVFGSEGVDESFSACSSKELLETSTADHCSWMLMFVIHYSSSESFPDTALFTVSPSKDRDCILSPEQFANNEL